VVRINLEINIPDKQRIEYAVLKAIEPYDIGPKVYIYEQSEKKIGRQFLVLQYIETKDICGLKINNAAINMLAREVAGVHRFKPDKILTENLKSRRVSNKEFIYKAKAQIKHIASRLIDDKDKERVCTELQCGYKKISHLADGLKQRYTLCHGDLNPGNFIINGNSLKLIDWERVHFYEPAIDISTLFHSFRFNYKQRALFLDQYNKLRNDRALIRLIPVFYKVKAFRELCWLAERIIMINNSEIKFITAAQKDEKITEYKKLLKRSLKECQNLKLVSRNFWIDATTLV
jgi:thiamine kinase-like enzyme